MRDSKGGRTKKNRKKAEWGRKVWAKKNPLVNPFAEPAPIDFVGADTRPRKKKRKKGDAFGKQTSAKKKKVR